VLKHVDMSSGAIDARALAAMAQDLRRAVHTVQISVVGNGGPAWRNVLQKLWRAGTAPAAQLLPTPDARGTWIVIANLTPQQARQAVQQQLSVGAGALHLPMLGLSGGVTTEPITLLLQALHNVREAAARPELPARSATTFGTKQGSPSTDSGIVFVGGWGPG